MRHAVRVGTVRAVIAPFVFTLVLLGTARAQKPEDIEAEIRKAQKDGSTVLVVMDVKDKYCVFPVSGISEVAKNSVTVKKGTFTILDAKGDYPAAKTARELLAEWKAPTPGGGNIFATVDSDAKGVSGQIGKLKEDLTIEVKKILLTSAQK